MQHKNETKQRKAVTDLMVPQAASVARIRFSGIMPDRAVGDLFAEFLGVTGIHRMMEIARNYASRYNLTATLEQVEPRR